MVVHMQIGPSVGVLQSCLIVGSMQDSQRWCGAAARRVEWPLGRPRGGAEAVVRVRLLLLLRHGGGREGG